MAGRTKSKLSLNERKQRAFRKFNKGFGPADAYHDKKLNISYDTARRYYKEWEAKARESARKDPDFLRDILANTLRALEELDEIRRAAWKEYSKGSLNPQVRQSLLNTMLRAQEQRQKLMGVFGVRQEVFVYLQQFQLFQVQLLDFLKRKLCAEDREQLIEFLDSPEIRPFLGGNGERDPLLLPAAAE